MGQTRGDRRGILQQNSGGDACSPLEFWAHLALCTQLCKANAPTSGVIQASGWGWTAHHRRAPWTLLGLGSGGNGGYPCTSLLTPSGFFPPGNLTSTL